MIQEQFDAPYVHVQKAHEACGMESLVTAGTLPLSTMSAAVT